MILWEASNSRANTNTASDSIMFFAKLCSVAAAEHITNQLLA